MDSRSPLTRIAFKYLTPKLRLDETSLTAGQILSRSFHMVCSSRRVISLADGIHQRRKSHNFADSSREGPIIVWEPVSDLCIPSEVEDFRRAVRVVDVVSPNADELASFFGSDVLAGSLNICAGKILSWGIGPSQDGILVVREGANGCTIHSRYWRCHLPAYFQRKDSFKVIDPTGGGNTFLGALAIALVKGNEDHRKQFAGLWKTKETITDGTDAMARVLRASILASIAASYAIEQAGMPELQFRGDDERWNGQAFLHRLASYLEREQHGIRIEARVSGDIIENLGSL